MKYLALFSLPFSALAVQYPVGITNCGVKAWIPSTPQRAVTMNQGVTEIMLALGLEDHMVGTAYLDDEIWPELAEAYAKVPVLSAEYPDIDTLLSVNPDFVYASYRSAFATNSVNYTEFLGECDLVVQQEGDKAVNVTHCRQELNDKGIQTYLQKPACELIEHRHGGAVTVQTLYDEIWEIANIFNVFDEARTLIDSIEDHFVQATRVAEASAQDVPASRVLWLDSWDKETPFVGACCGSVNAILQHAGAENVFDELGLEEKATWESAPWADVVELDPDMIVLVDASWDLADQKIFELCSNNVTRNLRAVQNRAFLSVPFSASTLGVRIGSLSYNLAEAIDALAHSQTLSSVQFSPISITSDGDEGSQAVANSGVKVYTRLPVWNGTDLETFCPGSTTPIQFQDVPKESEAMNGDDGSLSTGVIVALAILGVAVAGVVGFLAVVIVREKQGKPMFDANSEAAKGIST